MGNSLHVKLFEQKQKEKDLSKAKVEMKSY